MITYQTPEGCERLFDEGIERYGSLGSLLRYAVTLPRTPLGTLSQWWWPGQHAGA